MVSLTPWTVAYQTPLSMGVSRQQYWSGLPLPFLKESWALKNLYFSTVVLEKTLESPLDSKEIQPVRSKGNQSWIFIGRTEAETPIPWTPDAKNWLIGKDHDARKEQRWEEKGTTEDEMNGLHHQLNGYEFEQALGVGDGQGSRACCSSWGVKESDMTERLNWTELRPYFIFLKCRSIHWCSKLFFFCLFVFFCFNCKHDALTMISRFDFLKAKQV